MSIQHAADIAAGPLTTAGNDNYARAADIVAGLEHLLSAPGATVVLQRDREGDISIFKEAPFTRWRCDAIKATSLYNAVACATAVFTTAPGGPAA